MNVPQKNEWWCRAGWLLTLVAACLIIHYATGCSGSQKAAELAKVADDVSRCSEKITETIFANDGCSNQADCCNRAQFRVDGILKTLPVCKGWRPFEVCGLLDRDGGVE